MCVYFSRKVCIEKVTVVERSFEVDVNVLSEEVEGRENACK